MVGIGPITPHLEAINFWPFGKGTKQSYFGDWKKRSPWFLTTYPWRYTFQGPSVLVSTLNFGGRYLYNWWCKHPNYTAVRSVYCICLAASQLIRRCFPHYSLYMRHVRIILMEPSYIMYNINIHRNIEYIIIYTDHLPSCTCPSRLLNCNICPTRLTSFWQVIQVYNNLWTQKNHGKMKALNPEDIRVISYNP